MHVFLDLIYNESFELASIANHKQKEVFISFIQENIGRLS